MKINKPVFNTLQQQEWLVTNGLGGYASSSLSGANTRRYHGLLVASFNPPTDRRVLVSKIEETVSDGSISLELSTNAYPGAVHPEGYQYINSFERLPIPRTVFGFGDVKLAKAVFMVQGSNTPSFPTRIWVKRDSNWI